MSSAHPANQRFRLPDGHEVPDARVPRYHPVVWLLAIRADSDVLPLKAGISGDSDHA
jgi:hypothetical protein